MRFRSRTVILAVAVITVFLGSINYWDAIPGTLYEDNNGFLHGTGQAEYFYDDGSLMLCEWHFRGLIYRSTWFKPAGTEIATERYNKKTGGIGYYLRQDGSIKSKYVYEYSPEHNGYVSAGRPVYYDQFGIAVPDAPTPKE